MDVLLTLWRQVQLLRLHSVDLALVLVILLQTTHFLSDILQETSLTEKVLSYRMDRYHQLHLWMQDLLQQQQLTRVILQQLQMLMLSLRDVSIILTRVFMKTEYLTHTE